MPIHKSSVNFKNLIQDLADMYPFEISEVVLVELIANSLDAGATLISIDYNPEDKILIVTDNGEGMNKSQFEEYHDFAAGLKKRGEGIGFAGLGAKVSFNIADRVISETRSKSFSGGSNWYLRKKSELIWEDIEPDHLYDFGTRVEVHFRTNAKISFFSQKDFLYILRRHYFPLIDPKFLNLYDELGYYSKDLRFKVNNQLIKPVSLTETLRLNNIKEVYPERGRGKKKKYGYGIFGVSEVEYPIALDTCGVLLCTHGKVIKSDFFKQFPGTLGPYIFGIFEIPDFIKFLTTAKTDFARKGRHKKFEKLYDPIRQAFKGWLKEIGIVPTEVAVTEEAKILEKEIKKLLDDIPELSKFFGFWIKKDILSKNQEGDIISESQRGVELTFPFGEGIKKEGNGLLDEGEKEGYSLIEDKAGGSRAKPISRTSKRGPKISFVETTESSDLAWIEGTNIVINAGHPSFKKVKSNSRILRIHNLFAIANAIQRFINIESDTKDFSFVDRFMKAWGEK